MKGSRVPVTDTATLVFSYADQIAPYSVLVTNAADGEDCDVGGADVESGEGYPLAAGDSLPIDLKTSEKLYAICAEAGSTTLHVLRTGS